jgi:hypothetical protein
MNQFLPVRDTHKYAGNMNENKQAIEMLNERIAKNNEKKVKESILSNFSWIVPFVFNTIWRTLPDSNKENEYLIEGKDFVLCAGKIAIMWNDIAYIETMSVKALELLRYDVTNIRHCCIVNLKNGKWFYALIEFDELNNRWTLFKVWKQEQKLLRKAER